ncbi:MAG: LysM peptidoglycan-binding domain-containing M23 family metallopeptidase [Anaerolineae bacterium]
MRHRLLLWFLIGSLLLPAQAVAALEGEPPEDPQTATHVVQAGETLFSVARRYSLDPETLIRLNALSDPRNVYAGQRLELGAVPADIRSWRHHTMQWGEDLSLLTCYSRKYDVDAVAQLNGLLNPSHALPGTEVLLPIPSQAAPGIAKAGLTPLELAFRYERSLWEVMRLNPRPLYAGGCVWLPGIAADGLLPYPLEQVHLSQQPIERGETVVLTVRTWASATCKVAYLGRTTTCFAQDDGKELYALLGLSPLLEPDAYEIEVNVRFAEGELTFTLPLVVTPGRFGFERIDMPPDRQALFDAELLAAESAFVDGIATVHTAQRYWEVPFAYPVHSSVSSYFGARRSYGGSYNSYHAGVDFRASTGVPVEAPAAGTVVMAEPLTVRGNALIIDHGWGVLTGYWHLSKIEVEVGQRVAQGQVIGRVGNTGLSTGSHLHWQLWVDGQSVDPLQWTASFHDFPEPSVASLGHTKSEYR